MNKFIIRELKLTECNSLIDLWVNSSLPIKHKGRDTKENIEKQLLIENNRFYVAEIKEKLVGSIIASHNGRKGWINRLAVLPEFRGKGIASSLIVKAEKFFISNNIKIFACLIEDWNDHSMKYFIDKDYIEHKEIIYFTKKLNPEV